MFTRKKKGHAVVIVGYDEIGKYWIVRNSWGANWNGDGHLKVGYGECSIESSVFFLKITPKKIYVPDDYSRIQEAIDNAKSGDIIIVRDGVYRENIRITKSVVLTSENGSSSTIIEGVNSKAATINITASYVVLKGFTIQNGSVGVYVHYTSKGNKIADNIIQKNNGGIYAFYSNRNRIINNIIQDNRFYSINLYNSSENLIFNNVISGQVYLKSAGNVWNSSKLYGKNILGGYYLGGNVWMLPNGMGFSETCTDGNEDKICDQPYLIAENNTDYLPLKFYLQPITTPTPTPKPTPTLNPEQKKIFIEPNKTTVLPGEIFAVDISVQDGTTSSVLVNFSYDANKITYVSGSTYGKFDFADNIVGTPTVRYIGVSTTPVSIADKTKVATAIFRVNEGASGTANFSVITANVNGTAAEPHVVNVTIVVEPWQRYDYNENSTIDDEELIAAIMDWLDGKIEDMDLINVIMKWLQT